MLRRALPIVVVLGMALASDRAWGLPCCAGFAGYQCNQTDPAQALATSGCFEVDGICYGGTLVGGPGFVGCFCVDGVCAWRRTPSDVIEVGTPGRCAEAAARGCCTGILNNCAS
jgi:hypothetical protein